MSSRGLVIEVIREVVRGLPIADVQKYADTLPAQVVEGAKDFCEDYGLGRWFQIRIRAYNISVASELYQFIGESKQAVVQRKEALTSGERSNVKP